MSENLQAKIENKNDVMIVSLTGSLDVSLQTVLKDKIIETSFQESDIVLNFEEVTFIDSSCLGVLVACAKSLRDKKGNLKISCLKDDVMSIFNITRLDQVFDIYDSVDEAVQSYFRT